MSGKSVEINCPSCGRETLLMRQPKYDGFKRAGEILSCSACGHEFASEEEVPFKEIQELKVFGDDDRSKEIKIFREDEKGRICRYCINYIVNPFTQYCSHHKKEVEATDTCPAFAPKPAEPPKKPLF
jgi:transcription elongation factor Elf1